MLEIGDVVKRTAKTARAHIELVPTIYRFRLAEYGREPSRGHGRESCCDDF